MSNPYDDMLDLPHHVSEKHPRMSMMARAAQFAPFAALTGHEDAIRETARLTDEAYNIEDGELAQLDIKMMYLKSVVKQHPVIEVTYFLADEKKKGGAYITFVGKVLKIDDYDRIIKFTDGTCIAFSDIFTMEGEIFDELNLL